MASLTPSPKMQFFDANGNPLAGGKLYTYTAGGTSTPQATYTDYGGGTPNANPVILDSRGEASVWLGSSTYYMVLKDSTDVQIWTADNIGGPDVATLAALAASGGSALIGYLPAGSGAVATTVQTKLREFVSIKDFGATGNGTTDDTAAIQAAINAANANSNVYFPDGTYKVTSTITINKDRVHLIGAGVYSTKILFAPTADDICFVFETGTTTNQGSIRDLTVWSDDSTYTKTAMEFVDLSGYLIENIVIGGSVVSGGAGHWSGGTGSIGIRTRGRDSTSFTNITAFCDKPIVISVNPNSASISIDHFNFHNLYLGGTNYPLITIDTGVVLTQVSFTGFQAWVNGEGGLYWVDTTSTGVSDGVVFENVRYEGNNDITKYFMRIETNSGLQGMQVIGGQNGNSNGFYLRNVRSVHFDSFTHSTTGNEAFNADSTCTRISITNSYWQTGSTATLTNLLVINQAANDVTMPLPCSGYIMATKANSGTWEEVMNSTISGSSVTLADSAVSGIGATQQTGHIFITTTDDVSATFILTGPSGTSIEVSDPSGFFSNTAGTASSYNVYWSAGNSRFEVENKRGASKTIKVFRVGRGQ